MSGWTILAFASLTLAAIPCGLFLSNLFVYRPIGGSSRRKEAHSENGELGTRNAERRLEPPHVGCYQVSALIPARNEEASIRAALESVLANRDVDLEVLVLDDHSTDRTTEIVRELAARDPRVRLIAGEPLPPGWCGKQFACHTLAQNARHPLLVFMDADVRLNLEALKQMAGFVAGQGVSLASGVPRQLTGTFLERLLIPLIHFVLLGFLPMIAMRRSVKEKFAAGCGQLFIARRDAYFTAGGHAAIRASLHDGVKLPRAFRRAGFRTDLFDATDLATCRMYRTNAETWRGLGKNATEGLGAPGVLPVMTALLLGGQVLPFLLLAALPWLPANAVQPTFAAALCAWIPRLIAARRFQQSLLGALLHPLGVALLLAIQWQARWRQRAGAPMSWKGRDYVGAAGAIAATAPRPQQNFAPQTALLPLLAVLLTLATGGARAAELKACAPFTLTDQYRKTNSVAFPRAKPLVLLVADKEGSSQINPWIAALKESFGARVDFAGVADTRAAPALLRGRVRSIFAEKFTHPVMLDWSGAVFDQLGGVRARTTLIVVGTNGIVHGRFSGKATTESRAFVAAVVEKSLLPGAIAAAAKKAP